MPHSPDAQAQASFMMDRTLHHANRSVVFPGMPTSVRSSSSDLKAGQGRPLRLNLEIDKLHALRLFG